jgi:hypothetical protein
MARGCKCANIDYGADEHEVERKILQIVVELTYVSRLLK